MSSPRTGSLAVIFLIVFIDLLGFGMVLPLLPVYAKQFGHDEHGAVIGLLMASFSAMQFLFAPMWGRLSDRIGRRPVLLVGLAGSVVFYALFGVATIWQSMVGLFVARIGAGIAGATISTAQAYIADSTTLDNRTRGMALIGAAFGIGFTFGPLLGAAAVFFSRSAAEVAVSPWPGFVAALLSALAFGLAMVLLPESLVRRENHTAATPAPGFRAYGFNFRAWGEAFRTPSVGALLITAFIAVMAFGGFETTLSLLLNDEHGAFQYQLPQVLLVFAFIGIVLVFIQGGVVRQLSGRVSEVSLGACGGLCTIVGFGLLIWAAKVGVRPREQLFRENLTRLDQNRDGKLTLDEFPPGREKTFAAVDTNHDEALSESEVVAGTEEQVIGLFGPSWTTVAALLFAAAVEVTGFAFMNPALQALISRRSDPEKQGAILGVSQSVTALARITAPIVAIPLFFRGHTVPYWMSIGLLILGLGFLFYAARRGRDYGAAAPVSLGH